MQILPNSLDSGSPAYIKADGGVPEISQSAPFASLLESLTDKAAQQAYEVSPTKSVAMKREAAQHESGQQGIGQGVKVSREDFAALRENLAAKGMSEDDIKDLEEQVNSDEGLTWKDMLQVVSDKLGLSFSALSPEITDSMRNELTALFSKMGFTEEQSQSLITGLEDGKQVKVWNVLFQQAGKLDSDTLQSITRGELKSLATALGLPKGALQRLDSMLAGDPDGTLPAKGARMTLEVIFNETAKVQKKLEEQLGSLRSLIESGMERAREVKDLRELADNRESKDVSQAKVKIDEEAKKTYREGGDKNEDGKNAAAVGKGKEPGLKAEEQAATKAGASEAAKKQDMGDKAGVVGKESGEEKVAAEKASVKGADKDVASSEAAKASSSSKETAGIENVKAATTDAKEEAAAHVKSEQNSRPEAKDSTNGKETVAAKDLDAKDLDSKDKGGTGDGKNQQQDSDRKAFQEMWGRVTSKGGQNGESTMQQAERIVNQNFTLNAENAAETSLGENVPPKNIARTVQNGILQNLQQGGKQLTLRLDPPSLGKLTVIMQVHNNEIRATIRTENSETGKVVNDQLNLIRHALEQQGLKVEKLDVQTQTNNDQQHRAWQGAEEHNMAQNRNQDSSMRSAMKTFQNKQIRGDGDETLAHEMQNDGSEASISHQGIHVIA